jgi:hypothetical protein
MRLTVLLLILAGANALRADCVSGGTRPATPDESKFEVQTQTALQNALVGTLPQGWKAGATPAIKATSNYCTGDKTPIGIGYRVSYENTAKKQEAFAKITAQTASKPAEMKKIMDEASFDTDVKIALGVNSTYCALNGDAVKKIDVPGAKLALRSTDTDSAGSKTTTTQVCIGNWQITKTVPTAVESSATFPVGGPRTSVRTITINIVAEANRADQLLKTMKLQDLESMMIK